MTWRKEIEKRLDRLEIKDSLWKHSSEVFKKLSEIACEKPQPINKEAVFCDKKPLFCCSTNKIAAEMDDLFDAEGQSNQITELLNDIKDHPNVKETLNLELPDKVQIYVLKREVKNLKAKIAYKALSDITGSFKDATVSAQSQTIESLQIKNKQLKDNYDALKFYSEREPMRHAAILKDNKDLKELIELYKNGVKSENTIYNQAIDDVIELGKTPVTGLQRVDIEAEILKLKKS